MTINDILKESWLSISGNKIRSFLTILGIIIGVMAVVIMMSVGDAVQNQITSQFSSIGTNTIMIRAGASQSGGIRTMSGVNTLTIDDAEAMALLPDVQYVTPARVTSGTIVFGNKNWNTTAIGSYPTYQNIQSIEMDSGTFFDWSAVRNASTYVVVGPTIAKELELGPDPVGQIIRMNGVPLVVIGVTKEKGGAGMVNNDEMVFIPITTLQKRVMGSRFPNSIPQVAVKLTETADNAIAVEQVKQLLRTRHRIKDGADDDFQITDMKQIMETMNTVTGFLKMLLMAIASVSLLVGSIGIMNMMLVSVAERTREIGIRKAIGARESHITIQFLSEAILISFMGSLVGLILGVVLSQTILPGIMDMQVPLSVWSVFLSIGVAVIVGVASGVMPARKAAKLNPIDALRYE